MPKASRTPQYPRPMTKEDAAEQAANQAKNREAAARSRQRKRAGNGDLQRRFRELENVQNPLLRQAVELALNEQIRVCNDILYSQSVPAWLRARVLATLQRANGMKTGSPFAVDVPNHYYPWQKKDSLVSGVSRRVLVSLDSKSTSNPAKVTDMPPSDPGEYGNQVSMATSNQAIYANQVSMSPLDQAFNANQVSLAPPDQGFYANQTPMPTSDQAFYGNQGLMPPSDQALNGNPVPMPTSSQAVYPDVASQMSMSTWTFPEAEMPQPGPSYDESLWVPPMPEFEGGFEPTINGSYSNLSENASAVPQLLSDLWAYEPNLV